MSYYLEIEEDDNGDLIIQLPEEAIETLGWEPGIVLTWDLSKNTHRVHLPTHPNTRACISVSCPEVFHVELSEANVSTRWRTTCDRS